MTPLEGLSLALGAASILRGLRLASLSRRLGEVPTPPEGQAIDDADIPSLTVLAAARDEADGVKRAVESWLALDLKNLQVIVIDDRSQDETPRILADMKARDPRLTTLTLSERKEGWLGKCNALAEGARLATGEFLLFTDADVELDPQAMRRVLAHARAQHLDHLSLLPRIHSDNVVQESLTWLFFQAFLLTTAGRSLNRDPGGSSIGVGAFNMVRREAYEALGGHESLRLQVGDDVALARMLVRAGYRQRVHWGQEIAQLQWQSGVLGTIKGLEKNVFWGFRFSLPMLIAATVLALLDLLPLLAAPLAGSQLAWLGLGAWSLGLLAAYGAPGVSIWQRLRAVTLHPVSVLLLLACSWNSAFATLRRGGICWRGDFFSVAELKGSLKPLSWWLGPKKKLPSPDRTAAA